MIRVLAIALLAFGALVVVTHRLPESAFQPTPVEAGVLDATSFPLREGAWEGPLDRYLMDGTFLGTARVRLVHRTLSDTQQRVEIREHHDDGRVVRRSADHIQEKGGFELLDRQPDGSLRSWNGHPAHGGILWSWIDPATGHKEIFLERMIRVDGGVLLLVNGVAIDGDRVLMSEGRYRRVEGEDG